MLAATKNKYGGVYVNSDEIPDTEDAFIESLSVSLEHWKKSDVKVVWLHISSRYSHLIPAAMRYGFEYHHCSNSELMLVRRLVKHAALPSFATHTVGVGGVVFSERHEILTIVERRDIQIRPQYYKFPGGMLDHGEHIADGVVREVYEETGVKTVFEGLISFRHHHGGQFDTSNFYAACLLKPLTEEIVIDEMEIGKALWMPVSDFLENRDVGLYNKHVVKIALRSEPLTSIKIDGYMNSADDYEVYSPGKV